MPVLKPISGHTSVKPAMRYLEKKNRALAVDFVNIDAPAEKSERLAFDWASVMDRTRRESGNDIPWRAKRVRTYKHYIISPDPEDGIDLEALQDLATSWAREHFGDYEVAIVYHDDNERGIPHAHVVVNNTNLATGRRLQDPDPTGLNHSLQRMANERRMNHFPGLSGPSSVTGRTEKQFLHHPKSLQREYVRSAEAALIAKGEYSWTADIRARVRIARTVARSEAEFRGALAAMGIAVADNSPKAARRDWVYSLADHPTRRISGEKLGLAYGRERLLSAFELNGAGHLPDASEREIARIAKSALEVGDLDGLNRLSRALSVIEANRIEDMGDLKRLAERSPERKAWTDPDESEHEELIAYIAESGILPERRSAPVAPVPASRRKDDSRRGTRSLADRQRQASRQRDDQFRGESERSSRERGDAR